MQIIIVITTITYFRMHSLSSFSIINIKLFITVIIVIDWLLILILICIITKIVRRVL